MKENPLLYLASASLRRQILLQQIGIPFQCLPIQIAEEISTGESPKHYADRLALAKAQAGWQSAERKQVCPALGADTIVVFNENILGKPRNKEDGIQMLRLLSGNTHEVLISIAIVQNDHVAIACSVSRVQFRDIASSEMEAYWNTQEPVDKAGGYAIQGTGAIFVKHIEGSYSGIMGLPLYETALLLNEFNIRIL